jgi:carboxymethylenebutenolidase
MSETTPLSVFEPAGDAKGGLVVIQEIFGVNDHIEDVCRRLAAEGWLAVAPHLFHRSGDPKLGYDAMDEGRAHAQELTADGVMEDVDAAIARIADAGIPLTRTGIVGFCMGGSVALVTAVRRELGAAVTFYGGGITEGRFGFGALGDEAPALKVPWLGLYGDLDTAIPIEGVEELRIAAARSGQPTEIVRYPEAGHGFNCDQRASYHKPSATDAWRRMLEWFDHHLR